MSDTPAVRSPTVGIAAVLVAVLAIVFAVSRERSRAAADLYPEDGIARVVSNGRVLLAGHDHGDTGFHAECAGCYAKLSELVDARATAAVDRLGPAIERYVAARIEAALIARTQTAAAAPITSDVKEK